MTRLSTRARADGRRAVLQDDEAVIRRAQSKWPTDALSGVHSGSSASSGSAGRAEKPTQSGLRWRRGDRHGRWLKWPSRELSHSKIAWALASYATGSNDVRRLDPSRALRSPARGGSPSTGRLRGPPSTECARPSRAAHRGTAGTTSCDGCVAWRVDAASMGPQSLVRVENHVHSANADFSAPSRPAIVARTGPSVPVYGAPRQGADHPSIDRDDRAGDVRRGRRKQERATRPTSAGSP